MENKRKSNMSAMDYVVCVCLAFIMSRDIFRTIYADNIPSFFWYLFTTIIDWLMYLWYENLRRNEVYGEEDDN